MEWAAFGLARDPFQRSAELDDACLPNTVSALLSELLSSLRSPQGVSILVGEGGSGKSMAAAAFARRAGGSAYVAYLPQPTSCVTAIARDALAQFEPDDFDFATEEDWIPALRARIERCTRAGRTSVILLDEAHRLSPQTLQDLAEYFAEDDSLRLHVILFGRPKLLDRLQAGAEEALSAHILQICRLEPLGVRESVRYLERRMAICGGELAAILSDEAIDEIVQKAAGCVIRLEELTIEALQRAAGKGAPRATVVDVVAMARTADADEEDEVMAAGQQPLRFELDDDALGDEDVSWGNESDERTLEWTDEPADDAEDWQAGDETEEEEDWQAEDDEEEEEMRWDAAPPRRYTATRPQADDLEEEEDEPSPRAVAPPRRRMTGPAVLSMGACLALVWAANQMPGPGADEPRGRDAVMFAEPLSSEPTQIMRLATTAEAADADAHVHLWEVQPPRPVVASRPAAVADGSAAVADAGKAEPAMKKGASAAEPAAGGKKSPATVSAAAPKTDDSFVGPLPQRPAEIEVAAPASKPAAKKDVVVASAATKPPSAKGSTAKAAAKPAATASAKKKGPVYTVQLGAFKARRNAEDMVTKLRGKSPRILQEGGLYRVLSGSFISKKEAVVHEASLRRAGYTTYVRTAVF